MPSSGTGQRSQEGRSLDEREFSDGYSSQPVALGRQEDDGGGSEEGDGFLLRRMAFSGARSQ